MGKPCALCGRTDLTLTKEPIFGQWMEGVVSTRVGHSKTLIERDADTGEIGSSTKDIPWAMDQVEVRALCEPCNSGWGSALEGRVAALFHGWCTEPLIE